LGAEITPEAPGAHAQEVLSRGVFRGSSCCTFECESLVPALNPLPEEFSSFLQMASAALYEEKKSGHRVHLNKYCVSDVIPRKAPFF